MYFGQLLTIQIAFAMGDETIQFALHEMAINKIKMSRHTLLLKTESYKLGISLPLTTSYSIAGRNVSVCLFCLFVSLFCQFNGRVGL